MKRFAFVMIAGLISSPAFAVETEQTAPAAPAAIDPAPAPAAAEPAHAVADPAPARPAATEPTPGKPAAHETTHAASKPEAKDKDRKKPETAQKPALTKQAYVRLLAAEIKRRTPKSSDNKIGSIHVSFTVGASGRVVSHKVQNSSNPALEPVVGQILASVHTPPPPGGSFSAVQEFNFR